MNTKAYPLPMKESKAVFVFVNNEFRLRDATMIVAVFFLAGMAIPAVAEQADPFSTQGLTASSVAGSIHRPLLVIPCENVQFSKTPLSLTDVVEWALCNNPQTREAWANARVQAAQVGVGKSAYRPICHRSASPQRYRGIVPVAATPLHLARQPMTRRMSVPH